MLQAAVSKVRAAGGRRAAGAGSPGTSGTTSHCCHCVLQQPGGGLASWGPQEGLGSAHARYPQWEELGTHCLFPFCLPRLVFRLQASERDVAAACSALQWSRRSARSPSKPWRSEGAPPPLPLDRSMAGLLWAARQARGAANRRQCASCAALRPAWPRAATRHRCLISLREPRDPPKPLGCHRPPPTHRHPRRFSPFWQEWRAGARAGHDAERLLGRR